VQGSLPFQYTKNNENGKKWKKKEKKENISGKAIVDYGLY